MSKFNDWMIYREDGTRHGIGFMGPQTGAMKRAQGAADHERAPMILTNHGMDVARVEPRQQQAGDRA